jgi:hypothetical protein
MQDTGNLATNRSIRLKRWDKRENLKMKAPIGAMVSIYYDSPREIELGDVLRTPSGRCYLIMALRVQTRGLHRGRKHIRAIVIEEAPIGSIVHPLFWYPRNKHGTPIH